MTKLHQARQLNGGARTPRPLITSHHIFELGQGAHGKQMHDARRSRQTDVSNLYCARRFSRKKNTSVHGMGSAKAKAMELPILSSPTCSFAHPYSTQGQHNPTQHACLSLQHPMRPLSQLSAFACGHGSPPFSPMASQLLEVRRYIWTD